MRACSQPLGTGIGFFEEGRPALLDSRILRLVAASLVATWSPGHFCCCQGEASEAVAALSGGLAAAEDVAAPDSGCCPRAPASAAQDRVGMNLAAGCRGGCESSAPAEGDSCGCVHESGDAAPPTGTAIMSAGNHVQDTVDLLMALPPALAEVGAAGHRVRTCRGSPRSGPAQSLYALHCLLTT